MISKPNKQGKKTVHDALTEREKERYARNIIIREWGGEQGQLKLKRSIVLVVGAGGSGSSLLYYLAAAGVGTIRICDADSVTLGNLNRQILYNEHSIGKNKAKEASRVITNLNSDIIVEAYAEHLNSENISRLTAGCDLICCAADDKQTMRLLGRYSKENEIPIVWAGGYYMGGFLTFIEPPVTPCIDCVLDALEKTEADMKAGKIPMRQDVTFEVEGANPIIGAAAGAAGSLQAIEAIKYLVGFGGNLLGVMLEFQSGGMGMKFNQVDIDSLRKKDCPICGSQ